LLVLLLLLLLLLLRLSVMSLILLVLGTADCCCAHKGCNIAGKSAHSWALV
jgi:hypothetical protein